MTRDGTPVSTVRLNALLGERDRRSIGGVPKVIAALRHAPARTADLAAALGDPSPVVRMRAADALEKVSRESPGILLPHKRTLLALARTTTQQELRWHLAQMLPRLPLTPAQRARVTTILRQYLRDASSIVRTMALQGLVDLADRDRTLRPAIGRLLRGAQRTGTPAVRARARRLSAKLTWV